VRITGRRSRAHGRVPPARPRSPSAHGRADGGATSHVGGTHAPARLPASPRARRPLPRRRVRRGGRSTCVPVVRPLPASQRGGMKPAPAPATRARASSASATSGDERRYSRCRPLASALTSPTSRRRLRCSLAVLGATRARWASSPAGCGIPSGISARAGSPRTLARLTTFARRPMPSSLRLRCFDRDRNARIHSRDEVVTVQARGLAPDVASPATPPQCREAACYVASRR